MHTPLASAAPSRTTRRTVGSPGAHRRFVGALRSTRFGLLALAVVIGAGAGLGAVVFRLLVEGITWAFTGSTAFGQQGRVGSAHLPWLGLAFLVLAPVVGGLLYGPLVHRFAPEARGHGVPEVMVAVAERGGRIRPQVALVKALASAITIGSGGSVGREGPIVQIGSALASGFGQWIRMPEHRLRVLVACGAGGGIAATFNAPITGVFFGAEIILRELSAESLFALMVSAMVADAVAIPFLGDRPFLEDFPVHAAITAPQDYLLVALLAVVAAFLGQGFSKLLYLIEDVCDRLWRGRPEWARPAVGGVLVGLLLLALPQLYGVGYPVMFAALDGRYALGFLLLLLVGKMLATSLTLGVGGSGGVFAPSLFVGLMAGTAFGMVVTHVLGPVAGSPVLYAAMGMAGVFSSSTRAPLTALASIVEMTGAFGLALPVMLTVGIATAVSRELGYGTIYTTKLLRRGQDLERTAPWAAFLRLTAGTTMHPFGRALPAAPAGSEPDLSALGAVVSRARPQAVFEDEPIAEALRNLDGSGRDGLPVVATDGGAVTGWLTTGSVLGAVRRSLAAERDQAEAASDVPDPLPDFDVVELRVAPGSAADGRVAVDVAWPDGAVPVAVERAGTDRALDPRSRVGAGDVVQLLVRRAAPAPVAEPSAEDAVTA
ncbi:chloride channel protein [Amnibacterium kyonggiense]|uniref:CIC family chloride channel protein n=1 Tax=Amnibacterium kyonggiense TaxID=595671 RepID=A0A4R7FQ63_9MICO|nr:chloride channel protein [Amnibacterium kyonggiense]TDS79912.1 CIC family chloride channel protein [Amnibacterium kyonggiense]